MIRSVLIVLLAAALPALTGILGRTTDTDYLKFFDTFRTARGGAR